MTSLSSYGRRLRSDTVETAVREVYGDDVLQDEPDLVYAVDERLDHDPHYEPIHHLAEAAAHAHHAEGSMPTDGTLDDDTETSVRARERDTRDTLLAYVEDAVRDLDDDELEEWLGEELPTDEEGEA